MLALVLAVMVTGGVLLFLQAWAPAPAAIARRLDGLADQERPVAPASKGGRVSLRAIGTQVDPLLRKLPIAARLERLLGQAAIPWTVGEFAICCVGAAVLGCALGWAVTGKPAVGLAGAVPGFLLPPLQVQRLARRRARALNEQLPEAILLLATAVRAGNGFLQALQLLGRQLPEPLAGEVRTTLGEINLGSPFDSALLGLKDRVGTVEMEMVVVATLVQHRTGGNLSEILVNVHDVVRDRIRLRGDVQALTAQGRASAVILTALPVCLGAALWLINPSYIRVLLVDPRGQSMLAAAASMCLVGALAVRRIVDVRY